jgi:hypothetical protein
MSRTLSLAVAAALALLAAAPAAGAATPRFPDIPMLATTKGGAFDGRLAIERFVVRGSALRAQGRLIGTLKDRRYPGPQPLDREFGLRLTVTPVATPAQCARVGLTFASRTLRIVGLRATLPGRLLVIKPRGERAAAMREVLCAASAIAATPVPPPPPGQPPAPPSATFVHLLNALRLIAA